MDISSSQVVDLRPLIELPQLSTVRVRKIEPIYLAPLAECKALTTVDVRGCLNYPPNYDYSQFIVDMLAALPSVRSSQRHEVNNGVVYSVMDFGPKLNYKAPARFIELRLYAVIMLNHTTPLCYNIV